MVIIFRLLIVFLCIILRQSTEAARPLRRSNTIQQATYEYPIVRDPSIFNEPPNATVRPTQLRGEVYWPHDASQDSSTPVVLLLSGKHPDCRLELQVPSYGPYPWDSGAIDANGSCPDNQTVIAGYRGFDYLGTSLANRGIGVISIDPLFLNNCPFQAPNDPYLDAARARLLLQTIEILRSWDANTTASKAALGFDISRTSNFSNIGLMGHSRGGAGVRMAYNLLTTPERLPIPEMTPLKSRLNASIASVMEVAPLFLPEEGGLTAVVGAPWALVGAGCESDEIDYGNETRRPFRHLLIWPAEYLPLATQQGRLNPKPNFFLNVYGANHEFFNTEWHEAIDACLGDQQNTWNSAAPKFSLTTPQNTTVNIPLIQNSPKQQHALAWALLTFMEASLKSKPTVYDALRATPHRHSVTLDTGVEIGLQNPNAAVAEVLQEFQTQNLSTAIAVPEGLRIETVAEHAAAQFPLLQSQFKQYGPPPFYATLLRVPALPPVNLSLAENVTYGSAAVATLPSVNSSAISGPIRIQLSPIATWNCSKGTRSTIQIDLARRSSCLLPSLSLAVNANANAISKACATPRERTLHLRVVDGTAPEGGKLITTPLTTRLKSRFNFEWAPASFALNSTAPVPVALLPVAWETVVLERKREGGSTELGLGRKIVLEIGFDVGGEDEDFAARLGWDDPVQRHASKDEDGSDFLYVGVVRHVCS